MCHYLSTTSKYAIFQEPDHIFVKLNQPTMAYKAEDIDFKSYLNLNNDFTSPNLSNINKGKGTAPIQYQQPPIEKINTYAPLQNSQMFSGPSHQYDQHKQHIPLPPGALKAITAIPQPGYQFNGYPNSGMGSNTTSFFDVSDDFVDFSGMNGGHRPSFGGSNDIDMDFDSPVDMGYSGGSEFVDPNSIEDSPVPARAEVVRVYPGMHAHQAQQAALAKQQQQMEIQRQRQIKVATQPQQQSSHKPSALRGGNKEPLNPAQEAKISQILSQMRQDIKLPTNHNGDDQSGTAAECDPAGAATAAPAGDVPGVERPAALKSHGHSVTRRTTRIGSNSSRLADAAAVRDNRPGGGRLHAVAA